MYSACETPGVKFGLCYFMRYTDMVKVAYQSECILRDIMIYLINYFAEQNK